MKHRYKEPGHHWLQRAENIRKMWTWGIALLVVIAFLDVFLHPHAYFTIDGTFGFHSWFGFISCAVMVIVAKILGVVLKRKDDYYDD